MKHPILIVNNKNAKVNYFSLMLIKLYTELMAVERAQKKHETSNQNL
jgi:hypothetical protein